MAAPDNTTRSPNTSRNPNQAVNKANTTIKTTGHAWDGIEELNTPLPRWWVWVFLATIVFAVGYVAYYPAFPTVHKTVSDWTSLGQLQATETAASQANATIEGQIAATDLAAINNDETLRTYAIASGKALFALNCMQCHGGGAGGTRGYPNLLDDEWLFGGKLADIHHTINHGVRNTTDPEARAPAPMMAFGDTGMLTPEQVADVVNYLSVLAYKLPGNESTARGATVFAENCSSCHGANGEGMRENGAPPLNNAIWQYGGSNEDRTATVMHGRAGVMPAWGQKLSAADVKKLAVYVYNLGGGEPDSPTVPEAVSGTAAPTPPALPVSL